MQLSEKQISTILEESTKLLNKQRASDFKCVDFVRYVYEKAGINLPLISPDKTPENFPNLSVDKINSESIGKILFLKKKNTNRDRLWTHVGIMFSENELVHCSLMFGNKVCITPISEILEHYDIV